MARFFVLILALLSLNLRAQVFHYIISVDGSGDYRSIQSVINRLPDNSTSTTRVFIKNGVYKEKLHLPSLKKNISFIGESVEGIIISWDDYAGKDGISAANSYTFLIEGDDFYAENITIENTAGNVGQAIALRTTGERQAFKNCRFLGYQDTYYAHKNRQYNLKCLIEGATDFIYGDATAVFDSCTVQCLSGGQYITAPADTKLTSALPEGGTFYHGLLLRNCIVARSTGVGNNSYYLGRPWQPNASSVYINCTLDDHIKPEGWSVWSGNDNHLSSYFAEYNSIDTEGNPVDTMNRVDWSYQLSPDDVNNYYSLEYFLKKEELIWDPVPATIALSAPEDLAGDSFIFTWTNVPGAKGYTIIRNDTTIGFSESAIFTDETADKTFENIYKVKSVTEKGNLSEASEAFFHIPLSAEKVISTNKNPEILITDKIITIDEYCDVKIYSLTGQLLLTRNNAKQLFLNHFTAGTYVLVIKDSENSVHIKQFCIK